MVPPAVRNESNLRIGGYKSLYDTPITELKRAAAARRRKVSQQSFAAVCWPLILWSLPHFPATFFWRLEKNVHANSSAISRCPRGGRRAPAGAGRAAQPFLNSAIGDKNKRRAGRAQE